MLWRSYAPAAHQRCRFHMHFHPHRPQSLQAAYSLSNVVHALPALPFSPHHNSCAWRNAPFPHLPSPVFFFHTLCLHLPCEDHPASADDGSQADQPRLLHSDPLPSASHPVPRVPFSLLFYGCLPAGPNYPSPSPATAETALPII